MGTVKFLEFGTGKVRRKPGKRALAAACMALGAGALALVATGPAAHAAGHAKLGPTVTHTGKGPTGYTVTFRYYDPTATSVQIKGEWYFSDPAQTTGTSSQGLLPSQWRPGDVPIASPNATAANWPVAEMTEDAATGVWSFTTPLPSGTFNYGFFVNCASSAGTGCTEVSDPANPPWNDVNGVSTGSVEPTSQVYVPSDPRFGTVSYSWQAPSKPQGKLVDVSYPDPQSTSPVGSHPLVVYTPPGYNQNRKSPYPTLYLSHGGGGNEVDWSTQGVAVSIIDNLIRTGRIQPMVVVMTNFNGLPNGNAGYSTDVIDNVIPYVEAHYDVSASPNERAIAGLSAGGARVNDLLVNHTSEFGYYSVMSPGGGFPTTVTAAQAAAINSLHGLQIGGGLQDPIRANLTTEESELSAAGVRFTDDSVNGGHEWYVWRILLRDFLTQTAFKAHA
jgi:enterochelin esterase-like enzyme